MSTEDLSIDAIAASIIHDPTFEEHREHIELLAKRVLELLGDESPVLVCRVFPDNKPEEHGGQIHIWIRNNWSRAFTPVSGHIWVQGKGILPMPSPAFLLRSKELWPEGF